MARFTIEEQKFINLMQTVHENNMTLTKSYIKQEMYLENINTINFDSMYEEILRPPVIEHYKFLLHKIYLLTRAPHYRDEWKWNWKPGMDDTLVIINEFRRIYMVYNLTTQRTSVHTFWSPKTLRLGRAYVNIDTFNRDFATLETKIELRKHA